MEPVQNEVIICCLQHHQNIIDEIIEELKIEERVFDVKLILTEAIMNAYIHGNKRDCSKFINIKYVLQDKHLNIQVKDCGDGTSPPTIPKQIDHNRLLDDGGRGLYLMGCLSDKVKMISNTIHIDITLSNQ
ncbi:ATP-binding protein [Paenibacillus segetis]|uniref:Histidine kinase/HSP90-like ATPase domain-containing protein n=1 Tax=Paenibacillus segetis TaxID=1325360 RepID=A0ABQ1YF67_9BACL|nr:ATP-binding protein [Paenibacillus segetis]GGH23134.1 hypothetical protein GCM10008013_22020 [Paenibacillus segetis]